MNNFENRKQIASQATNDEFSKLVIFSMFEKRSFLRKLAMTLKTENYEFVYFQ